MMSEDPSIILARLLDERRKPMARWKLTKLDPPPTRKGNLVELARECFPK